MDYLTRTIVNRMTIVTPGRMERGGYAWKRQVQAPGPSREDALYASYLGAREGLSRAAFESARIDTMLEMRSTVEMPVSRTQAFRHVLEQQRHRQFLGTMRSM